MEGEYAVSMSLVLTVIGDDRPGLVELLSETIAANGGNWLESRMARLAGKFAGILRVSADDSKADTLRLALAALEAHGLHVISEISRYDDAGRAPVRLELVGADHPGIVRDVARALARRKVNVEELSTECTEAPHSGQVLFRATVEIHLPPNLSLEQLREELESVAHDLMVDITLGQRAG